MGLDDSKLHQLNLNPDGIRRHYRIIKQYCSKELSPNYLKIVDTCTVQNGMILKFLPLVNFGRSIRSARFAAFVPAAGASTRYRADLADLVAALLAMDRKGAEGALRATALKDAERWLVPHRASTLLRDPDKIWSLSDDEMTMIAGELSLPKALFPCTSDGASFLQIKNLEHQLYPEIVAQLFVTPRGMSQQFSEALDLGVEEAGLPTFFLEQDESLSTIRFELNGEPAVTDLGGYSMVPAGHGALIELYPRAKTMVPEADALFIRNVDNVNGASLDVQKATKEFFSAFSLIHGHLSEIRSALGRGDVDSAGGHARELMGVLDLERPSARNMSAETNDSTIQDLLWPLSRLFHCDVLKLGIELIDQIKELYNRPLNILGVVPNGGRDVGGTPVVVLDKGENIKVCLEVPHASPDDYQNFLKNPARASHFNPVFVASELVSDISFYKADDSPFWIIAKKAWQGREVAYFETVLFEIIGNSRMSNVIFLDIPRALFNPHKSLQDAKNQPLAGWSFP